MKHIHHDMIVKWAANPERYRVECYSEGNHSWFSCAAPAWVPEFTYKLIELPRKVKRWIAVWPHGATTIHYEKRSQLEEHLFGCLRDAQLIEIEVEMPYEIQD